MSNEKGGPYTIVNGVMSDRAIWAAEMDDESEARFDDYLYMRAVKEAAEAELAKRKLKITNAEIARRNLEAAYDSLLEDF